MKIDFIKLSDLAEIHQGYQFRKKIPFEKEGDTKVIQMANILDNRQIDFDRLSYISGEKVKANNFLNKHDLIFCSRGIHNYNIVIEKEKERIIAISQFLVIRPNKNIIKPYYLSWILKQPKAISYFNSNRLSGTVPLLNKKTLEELTIPVPPLDKQKLISDLLELMQREKHLVSQIQIKKEKLMNQFLRNNLSLGM